MFFKKIFLIFLIYIFVCGCSTKNILFIENDNYHKFSQYYLNDIQVTFKQFKLIGGFNSSSSFEQIKEIISLMKDKHFQKIKIYAIIFYPYGKENNNSFNDIFNYINNLESFLLKKKNYTNYLYKVGIPQNNINTYLVLIYFNKDSI